MIPPGAFKSIVSKGPINAHLRPNPSFIVASISSELAYPSEYNRIASFKSAPCNLFSIKPSISLLTVTIDEPESLKISLAFSNDFVDVFSPGQISTHGIRCGGLAGCAIRHLCCPLRFCVIFEIGMAEEDEPITTF